VGELAAAVAGGLAVPAGVVACVRPGSGGGVPEVARAAAGGVLGLVQEWLAAEVLEGARLVVVTRRAVDAGPGTPVDVGAAPVWGLVRVARAENPGRLVLADVGEVAGAGPLVVAAAGLGEPEFAVRGGQVLVPRLARVVAPLVVPAAAGWRAARSPPSAPRSSAWR